jgi:hypothetical protein
MRQAHDEFHPVHIGATGASSRCPLVERRVFAIFHFWQHGDLEATKLRTKSDHTIFHGKPLHQWQFGFAVKRGSSGSGSTLGTDTDVKSDGQSRVYLLWSHPDLVWVKSGHFSIKA